MTNGLRLHVIDVWVDELGKCQEDGVEMPLVLLIEPVLRLQNKTKDKAIRNRATEAFGDQRLKELTSDPTIREEVAPATQGNAQDRTIRYEDLRLEENGEDDEWDGIDEG